MASGKMKPHPNSPNGCFERHGYHTHRYHNKAGGQCRIIVAPDGGLALVRPTYEEALDFCKEKGLLQEE